MESHQHAFSGIFGGWGWTLKASPHLYFSLTPTHKCCLSGIPTWSMPAPPQGDLKKHGSSSSSSHHLAACALAAEAATCLTSWRQWAAGTSQTLCQPAHMPAPCLWNLLLCWGISKAFTQAAARHDLPLSATCPTPFLPLLPLPKQASHLPPPSPPSLDMSGWRLAALHCSSGAP